MALVLSRSWRRVMAEGICTPALPERSAIAASLHRGELVCCQRLCTRRYYPALLARCQIELGPILWLSALLTHVTLVLIINEYN